MLITGATSGIGLATAQIASSRGIQLVLSGRNEEKLSQLQQFFDAPIHTFAADLSYPGLAKNAVQYASSTLGGLDTIIHCAGIQNTQPLRDLSIDDFEISARSNIYSSLELASAFASKKIEKSNPSITFVSSISSIVGHSGEAIYSSTKGAIEAITRSLAVELAPKGIRVNCVRPGLIKSPMSEAIKSKIGEVRFDNLVGQHPLGLGNPQDIAESLLFLSSTSSKWITGSVLSVDGGYSISK